MKHAILRDSNVIFDDVNTKGFCSEIQLPDVQMVTTELKNLASVGSMSVFESFDKMECTMKFIAPDATIIKKMMNPFQEISLQIRSQRDEYVNSNLDSQQSTKYFVKGNPVQSTNGTRKKGETGERECKLAVTYIKEVQNGETLYELDIRNNIFIVDGEDLLKIYRQNLGLDA